MGYIVACRTTQLDRFDPGDTITPAVLCRADSGGHKMHTKDTSHPNLPMYENYGMATAEFLYGMPDFPLLLQTFVWQAYDLAPDFPRITRLVQYWHKNLEGPLYLVRIAHAKLIAPREIELIKLNPKHLLN